MTARKVIETYSTIGRFRIVRVHRGFSDVEFRDGNDRLGVERWCSVHQHDVHRGKFRTLTVDGETDRWVKANVLNALVNAIGDELMRQMKRGKKNRMAKR